jgi:outer membrane receptor protein involved in Fe transport
VNRTARQPERGGAADAASASPPAAWAWLLLVSLGLAAAMHRAAAQTPAPAPPGTAKPGLEEIVVTAQKRSERLSRVPISITALGKAQMDKQGVRDVKDIARLVPGLHLQASDELGNTQISIRGITSDTGAATTGIYIDETPVQARQTVVSSNPYPEVFDLDRVEVLRGPQGTLFGAGSEGGTVRFITPAPSLSTYSGYFRSEIGFTDGGDPSYELGGAVGGPVVPDKVGFRISLWDRQDGGYIDRINPVTGDLAQRNANSSNSAVGRAALLLQPIEGLTIEPAIFFQRVQANDRDFYWESAGPFNELAQIPQPHIDTYVLPSLDVNYDFGPFALKSITSYFKRDNDDKYDATSYELSGLLPNGGITLPGYPNYLSRGYYQQRQENYTEEVRLTSKDEPGDRFSWVIGLFYQHAVSREENSYIEPFDDVANYLSEIGGYGPGDSLSYFGEAPVGGKYSYLENLRVLEEDAAIFGNLTYAITPRLKASVGLRFARTSYSYNDFQDGPYGPGAPTFYQGGKTEHPLTPRFTLSWQLTDDQMLYATVAKGYRIGGANESVLGIVACDGDLASLGVKDVPHSYNSDSVWSYEVGDKASLFDHRVTVDASLFWIDWSGIQQLVTLPDCGYYYTANLGSAVSRGFDVQAAWAVGHGLTLSGTSGFTDAEYTTTVKEEGNILAKSGDQLPTPLWTATAAAQQDFRQSDGVGAYGRIDYQFAGPYYRTGSADTFSYNPYTRDAPATNYVTLRAGTKFGGWDISAFINNVLNSRVSLYRYQDVVGSPGLRDITFRPLTVGITAIQKF